MPLVSFPVPALVAASPPSFPEVCARVLKSHYRSRWSSPAVITLVPSTTIHLTAPACAAMLWKDALWLPSRGSRQHFMLPADVPKRKKSFRGTWEKHVHVCGLGRLGRMVRTCWNDATSKVSRWWGARP